MIRRSVDHIYTLSDMCFPKTTKTFSQRHGLANSDISCLSVGEMTWLLALVFGLYFCDGVVLSISDRFLSEMTFNELKALALCRWLLAFYGWPLALQVKVFSRG